MPNAWESAHGLDPASAEDGGTDADKDGYPNLEEYLNDTNPQQPEENRYLGAAYAQIRQDALAYCADGKASFEARVAAEAKQREADRDAALAALEVRVDNLETGRRISLGASIHFDVVPVPCGTFLMGSPESEGGKPDEHPQQPVTISRPFYLGATMVTSEQFVSIMGPTERRTREKERHNPVHEASWFEAVKFCKLLSEKTGHTFRLPTEAEWEYACRAGTTSAFNTGATINTEQANFDGQAKTRYNPAGVYRGKIIAVAQFPPNAWGLYDMHGNQAEYCLDNVGRAYSKVPVTDPVGPPGNGAKVLRGGKEKSKAEFVRSASRYGYAPAVGYGFRVLMEVEK
jgi:formylglycine-generating enzyme required for sulfatase activity